jgi:hypothetical protein
LFGINYYLLAPCTKRVPNCFGCQSLFMIPQKSKSVERCIASAAPRLLKSAA